MALSAKLTMRPAQTQSLAMTPQLLQSIRLLQFSREDLQRYVDQEVERNPLLTRATPAGGAAPDEGDRHANARDASTGVPGPSGSRPSPSASPRTGGRGTGDSGNNGDSGLENLADRPLSLGSHARGEVRDALSDRTDQAIGDTLAGHLDESGYLPEGEAAIAEIAETFGIEVSRVSDVLTHLQERVNPAGLFALSLADCLAIQLRRADRFDPVMQAVIDNLDLLGRRDFGALRRLTGESEAGLMDILAEIRRLDPKPGHAFSHGQAEVITPEVLVTEADDGGWNIELNPDALPRFLVDRTYLAHLRSGTLTQEERGFIGECQQSATWLERALDQRATTIRMVAAEIVKRQDGFLARGVEGLKPMTLMAVANAVGMHESTISRVTAGKHIATPRGTFEMRYFFTVAIASADGGDAHSAESVKHRIKALIDAERPGKVLSDDEIAAMLKSEGVDLARRTVAKYREAQGLPSSIRRRREMNARALAS